MPFSPRKPTFSSHAHCSGELETVAAVVLVREEDESGEAEHRDATGEREVADEVGALVRDEHEHGRAQQRNGDECEEYVFHAYNTRHEEENADDDDAQRR